MRNRFTGFGWLATVLLATAPNNLPDTSKLLTGLHHGAMN